MRPVIGISFDWQEKGSFSQRPHYALREAYFDAVWAAGGLPIGIPLIAAAREAILGGVDGVVVPGGDYPSPGWWYGDEHGDASHPRAVYDVELVKDVLVRDVPLLGICAGFQTMIVATGGKLHWRVKDKIGGSVPHKGVRAEEYAHGVKVMAGSKLAGLVGAGDMLVNSHHNEGAASLGDGVLAVATAPDGLVEAVEVSGKRFALGVQWHPEFFVGADTSDGKIWRGFVKAAEDYRAAQ